MDEVLGHHVTVVGPKSGLRGQFDVWVDTGLKDERFWETDYGFQMSAGWFETFEEAREFAHEVFTGYRIIE